MPTFRPSGILVEKIRVQADWVRRRRARGDIVSALFTTLSGYAAEQRAKGLQTSTLLRNGSLNPEARHFMRAALRLSDGLAGALLVELRDWVKKGKKRTRSFDWADLSAEGDWLWLLPKTPTGDFPPELVKGDMKQLEIIIRGPAGTGKSALAQEIGTYLRSLGLEAKVFDLDSPREPEAHKLALNGVIQQHMLHHSDVVPIRVQQTRRPVSLLDWGSDGLYDATRATHLTGCHASGRNSDGECLWRECPQRRDGEPEKTGRHCPLDSHKDE